MKIPKNINYKEIGGLSSESCQALEIARPSDLASAARIPGVTAAALIICSFIHKKESKKSCLKLIKKIFIFLKIKLIQTRILFIS